MPMQDLDFMRDNANNRYCFGESQIKFSTTSTSDGKRDFDSF